jgi:hypothetical protein
MFFITTPFINRKREKGQQVYRARKYSSLCRRRGLGTAIFLSAVFGLLAYTSRA